MLKNKKQKLSTMHYIMRCGTAVLFFLVVCACIIISIVPRPTLTTEKVGSQVTVNSELRLAFSLPVARQVSIELTPKTYGEIKYQDMMIGNHLARTIIFTPEVTWSPETTYEVRISGVKNALPTYRQPKEYVYTFTTESVPTITSVTPSTDSTLNPNTAWSVGLDQPNDKLSEFEFRFTPNMATTTTLSEDKKTYTITPVQLLSQGEAYQLSIFQKKVRYIFGTDTLARQEDATVLWQATWKVKEAPGIVSFSPEGTAVLLNSPLNVVFSDNIDFTSFKNNVRVSPTITGNWQTTDYKTMTLQPNSLAANTVYTVTLTPEIKTYDGGHLVEDSVHTFTTLGPVTVIGSSPAANSQGVGSSNSLSMTFNQEVDHGSAESKFSVAPAVSGDFSWNGATMIFKPKTALAYNTTYSITIAAGVKGQSGFDSVEESKIVFSTELSVTRLSVPFHKQEHHLSCEVATLVMALAYRNVSVSEATLIKAIGFDPTPKKNGVWGDPYKAFVGDIDGHQPSTGYGVYWDPIASAAKKYRSARVITGGNITDITAEIKKGNPVIFWGTAGTGKRIDWKTASGQNIMAVSGEHTRVVVGFIGPADNPTKIITLDPLFGEKYFTQASFLANWAVLGNNAVVVE
jgi:uncharacterized protein YvpB